MNTDTKQVKTLHGTVEYTTVECDSCGNEVKKENALHFKMYDTELPEGKALQATGWACEFCQQEGPAGFPNRLRGRISLPVIVIMALFYPFTFLFAVSEADKYRDVAVAHLLGCLLYGSMAVWLLF